LKPEEFKRFCGVRPETFGQMVKVLKEHEKSKKKSGRPSKLSLENQLLMTLEYLREYRTYFHIGQSWGLNESNVYRTISKVEKILIECGLFRLPGKKALLNQELEWEVVVVDVTETPIERPKKKQKNFYSGKKKKHTLKSQIVVEQKTNLIVCTAVAKGKEHDFKIFKKAKTRINKNIKCLGDKGYQGIIKLHKNSQTPQKKKKGKDLSEEENIENKNLAKLRIVIEHVNRKLKIFKIISSRYRNRRKRFLLRLNLIAGIYNYELGLPKFCQ
jgi:IS5 family transposase